MRGPLRRRNPAQLFLRDVNAAQKIETDCSEIP